MDKRVKLPMIVSLLLFFMQSFVYGAITTSTEWNFSIDLPEDFVLTDTAGNTCFIFTGTEMPVDCVIKIFPDETERDEQEILHQFITKLHGTTGTVKSFSWNGTIASIAEVSIPVPGTDSAVYVGIATSFKIPGSNNFLTAVSYTEEEWITNYLPDVLSIIDSINSQRDIVLKTGIVTTFQHPSVGKKEYPVIIDGKEILVSFDTADINANATVVEREYNVLAHYANSSYKNVAWERCYRMIYRDAFTRFDEASFIIINALKYQKEKPLTEYELASAVLSYLQKYTYDQKSGTGTFLSLPEALTQTKGDCDTRGVLMAVLLKHVNIDTVLLVSEKAAHAIPAVAVPGKGARFTVMGKSYLLAETTDTVNIGLIDSNIADVSLWQGFSFPD